MSAFLTKRRPAAAPTTNPFLGRSGLLAPTGDHLDPVHQQALDEALAELRQRGLALRGYQQAAVESIAALPRKAVLGYAPGLGKSAITLTAWDVLKRCGRPGALLLVVPPHLRVNWARSEVPKWTNLTVARVDGYAPASLPGGTDVLVVPDSIIFRRLEDILAAIADGTVSGLAFDESQRYKSERSRSQRTSAAFTMAAALQRQDPHAPMWSLTGTIVANRPEDVYGPLCLGSGPEALAHVDGARGTWDPEHGPRGWRGFRSVWSDGQWVNHKLVTVTGCKDPLRLHQQMSDASYLFVNRDEVTGLPPITWVPQIVDVNGSLATYRAIQRDTEGWVRQHFGPERAERVSKAEALVRLGLLDEHSALARTETTADVVEDLVAQGEQAVVFCEHRSALAALADSLARRSVSTARIVGGMTPERKAEEQRRFQDCEVDVVLCSIRASSTGINLDSPRGRTVVFHQIPWSPAEAVQCCGRVLRLTQLRACIAIVPLATDGGSPTLDQRKFASLQTKFAASDAIASGCRVDTLAAVADASVLDDVLASFGAVL
jgi:superfamily II DNA or RNA helicase